MAGTACGAKRISICAYRTLSSSARVASSAEIASLPMYYIHKAL